MCVAVAHIHTHKHTNTYTQGGKKRKKNPLHTQTGSPDKAKRKQRWRRGRSIYSTVAMPHCKLCAAGVIATTASLLSGNVDAASTEGRGNGNQMWNVAVMCVLSYNTEPHKCSKHLRGLFTIASHPRTVDTSHCRIYC